MVYDGICNLCTGAVRFLRLVDRSRTLKYEPYQELAPGSRMKYGMSDQEFQGRMHLIQVDGSLTSGPAAIAEVCRFLVPFKLVCNLFNSSLADRVYNFIARRRYMLFGCRESCFVVSEFESSKIRMR